MNRLFSRGVTSEPENFDPYRSSVRLAVGITVFVLVTLPCAMNWLTFTVGMFLIGSVWVSLGVIKFLDHRDERGKS